MATKKLASWATSLSHSDLPDTVHRAALRSFYNWAGCALGGATHPTVTKAHSALSPFFGSSSGPATLLGHGGALTADAPHAALLNGIASHVHDYDDTHLATIIHPTGPVASAALAYAEHRGGVSGADILLALTAGIEASCKLGLAVWPEHYDIGWHITSTTGSIGAAVAVGRLMGLDEHRMAHAIGLASVSVIGLREMFGSDAKSFHPGSAAMAGLRAAALAEKGFTSSEQALEAKRGWGNVVAGGGTPKLDEYLGQLGKVWEVERNAFKPFPCGIVCHPAIDACIQLYEEMHEQELALSDIKSVEARVHPLVIELTSKRKPKDGLEGKFSVFHGCAVGLLYGKAGPSEYTDAVVKDPIVVQIRDRIEAGKDESLRADETYVQINFHNGKSLEKHIDHAIGSLEIPMSDEQLEAKFLDQAGLVIGERALEASKACWSIAQASDVSAIARVL